MEEDAFFRKFILNIFLKEGEKRRFSQGFVLFDRQGRPE